MLKCRKNKEFKVTAATHFHRRELTSLLSRNNIYSKIWRDIICFSKETLRFTKNNTFESDIHRTNLKGNPLLAHISRDNKRRSNGQTHIKQFFPHQKYNVGVLFAQTFSIAYNASSFINGEYMRDSCSQSHPKNNKVIPYTSLTCHLTSLSFSKKAKTEDFSASYLAFLFCLQNNPFIHGAQVEIIKIALKFYRTLRNKYFER